MLKERDLIAVLPAKDLARARDFYRDVIGLDNPEDMEGNLLYRCGNGTGFLLYETENAGSAKNTQMGWATNNIEAEMEDLRSRGVVFEEYDFPGLKTRTASPRPREENPPGSQTPKATSSTSSSAGRAPGVDVDPRWEEDKSTAT